MKVIEREWQESGGYKSLRAGKHALSVKRGRNDPRKQQRDST